MGPASLFINVQKKMYHEVREIYWWEGIKNHVEEFVAKCQNCQQEKAKHQNPVAYYKKSKFLLCSRKTSVWIL